MPIYLAYSLICKTIKAAHIKDVSHKSLVCVASYLEFSYLIFNIINVFWGICIYIE